MQHSSEIRHRREGAERGSNAGPGGGEGTVGVAETGQEDVVAINKAAGPDANEAKPRRKAGEEEEEDAL